MTDCGTNKVSAGDLKKDKGLERFLDQIPVLPEVIYKAQDLLNQELLDIDKLVEVLESDPGTVVRILRIANSSFYGLSREIKSTRDACIVLGQYTLRNIIMTTVVSNTMQANESAKCQQLLEHCINTAVFARVLADITGQSRDVAYIVGLLHDIGSLFIEVIAPEEANLIREEMLHVKQDLVQAEKNILGFDHAELSGEVARYWKLPEEIAVSLQSHHKIQLSISRLNDLVYVADLLSMYSDEYEKDNEYNFDIPLVIMERLGLSNKLIVECIETVRVATDVGMSNITGQDE